MARRSSRRRPRRSSHKRRYRRNPGGGLGRLLGGGRKLFGVVDTGQLTQAAVAVGGFTLTAWLLAKLDKSNKLTGWNRILAKAGVAIAAGYALHMARAPRSVSAGIALGGLVSAGLDVYNKVKPGGMAGLGWYGVDAQDSQMYPSDGLTLGDMDELPEGTMVMDPSGATFVVAG